MSEIGVKRVFERMRGIYTPVTDLRRRLLMETVRFILDGKKPSEIESLPFSIIEMGNPMYRCCSYRELSIVKQRLRLAFGLPLVEEREHIPVSSGIEKAFTSEKIIETPLVNVHPRRRRECPRIRLSSPTDASRAWNIHVRSYARETPFIPLREKHS